MRSRNLWPGGALADEKDDVIRKAGKFVYAPGPPSVFKIPLKPMPVLAQDKSTHSPLHMRRGRDLRSTIDLIEWNEK